ncbi:hypothetical protein [Streptomyces sp. YIM 130001]|uniref:hypothetical protein n=1 Tax=Streptomyces sp. YIM 130001 TaxID=2259644 RepID=UPI0013C44F9C|nr:hypothetical protein [Streptomyces sp. YIM 130001]
MERSIDVLADDWRSVAEEYVQRAPIVMDAPGTYPAPTATPTVEWRHGIGDVTRAVSAAGLRLEFLYEHDRGHSRLLAEPPVP